MSVTIFFDILTNTNNATSLRTEVEAFLYNNFDTNKTEEPDILSISVSDKMPYREKSYKIKDSFNIYFGQYALWSFYDVNYIGFKDGIKTTLGTTIYSNFIISITCNFSENGTEKFALQLTDKILDITNGYLANSCVSNFLLKKYPNEILVAINYELDEDKLFESKIYIFSHDLVKRILSQDLLINLEPDWVIGEIY